MPAAVRSGRRLGIATVCLSGTLDDKLSAVAEAGFDGVEVFENDLVVSPWSPARVRERCADLGLTIDLYQPFRDFEAVPPDVLAANLRRAEHKFDVMAELGADTMLVCSSVSPDAVDDDDLAAEHLHLLASRAAERGIRIAYEALAWGRFVNTFDHSWRIVRRAGHPALGLCLDSFHVLSRNSDPSGIRVIPGEKVFFLQLADAPRLRMDVLQWSRHHRLFPGQGAFDLPGFVRDVLSTGYAGPLSLEVFNDVFRQSDPRGAAVDALRSLLVLQERIGQAPELPPAPPVLGHAFTELTATDDEVPQTLAAMGFTRDGEVWTQGAARVVVRAGDGPGARITAIGVASADPEGAARRAEGLLAPTVTGTSVAAPDGMGIVFTPLEPQPEPIPPGLVTATDHVSLTEPFDDFDRTALFYRALLGLAQEPEVEFAAPFGLVRSQGAAGGGVRLVLNVATLRRGDWAPAVPDPQHVAFATEDALGCAAAMRERGVPLLEIPENYYADLSARLDLPDDLLAALRERSVLYDRDESGEFLHFYTRVLGGRVFFEVVQRVGGYSGYGTLNTPVRMAAHRQLRLAKPSGAQDGVS